MGSPFFPTVQPGSTRSRLGKDAANLLIFYLGLPRHTILRQTERHGRVE